MATMSSSLRSSYTAAVNMTSLRRRANTGILLRLPKGSQGATLRLCCASRSAPESLCRASRSAPESKWWTTPLSPDDLIEPTGHGLEELKEIWSNLVEDPLRPLLTTLQEIKARRGNLFRCRSFHAGIVSGYLLLVAGLCQFLKVAPNLCVDIVLGYICYKLSVLAAELKSNRKANSICARIQFVLLLVLMFKDNPTKDSYFYFTVIIWSLALHVYACVVFFECIGIKHPERHLEAAFKTIVTTKGGLLKVLKFMFLGQE